MTNNEAIEQLKSILETGVADADVLLYTEDYEAIDYAINSLAQKPCDDCISREEAIRMFADDDYTVNELRNLPPVTPQPKVGEWLEKEINSDKVIEEWQSARCSVCDKYHTTPYMYYFSHYDYCPHCGSKMEGRQKVDKGRSKRNR